MNTIKIDFSGGEKYSIKHVSAVVIGGIVNSKHVEVIKNALSPGEVRGNLDNLLYPVDVAERTDERTHSSVPETRYSRGYLKIDRVFHPK